MSRTEPNPPPGPAGDTLQAAAGLHRAGRLLDAAVLYERALAADGGNADAMYGLGLLRHQLGDDARAEPLLGRAAALRPGVAAVWATWAMASLSLGLNGQAAERAREAVRLGRDDPLVRLTLGRALHALGRAGEAVGEFRLAVAMRPDFAAAHAGLGVSCLQEGRFDEARAALVRAVELEPGRADLWEHLAEFHTRAEEFDEAIACWGRVLSLAPGGRAYPHLALGWALQEAGRLDEAGAEFRAAAAAEPVAAEPRVNLGLLQMERGLLAEAEAEFRAAVRLRPSCEAAHYWLADLLGAALPDADLDALSALLDDPATAPEPRTRLLFALGKVLDARGEYARAAACLRQANASQLAQARGPRRLDPAGHTRFVDGLIRAFDRDFFARLAGAGLETRAPVFVVGLPRSGTTLVEQILASHPRVHGAGELPLGRLAFETLPAALNHPGTPADCAAVLDRAAVRRLAESYLDRLRALPGGGADRVVDKLPENYFNLGLLTALFPDAAVIHCRRDLKDVALSCWMADFRSLTWTNDPAQIGSVFREYLRLMGHWRSALPVAVHEVDYEETVSDLEGVARRLVAALGLEWDPACLEFHRTSRPVRTASRTQVRRPVYTGSVGRWRRYEHELADLFAALPPVGDRAP